MFMIFTKTNQVPPWPYWHEYQDGIVIGDLLVNHLLGLGTTWYLGHLLIAKIIVKLINFAAI